MNITGVKRASGAWKRSGPILITLPSGNCVEITPESIMRMSAHNVLMRDIIPCISQPKQIEDISCNYHFLDSITHAGFCFPLIKILKIYKWSLNRRSTRALNTHRILFNQYCRFKTKLVLTFIIDTANKAIPWVFLESVVTRTTLKLWKIIFDFCNRTWISICNGANELNTLDNSP